MRWHLSFVQKDECGYKIPRRCNWKSFLLLCTETKSNRLKHNHGFISCRKWGVQGTVQHRRVLLLSHKSFIFLFIFSKSPSYSGKWETLSRFRLASSLCEWFTHQNPREFPRKGWEFLSGSCLDHVPILPLTHGFTHPHCQLEALFSW